MEAGDQIDHLASRHGIGRGVGVEQIGGHEIIVGMLASWSPRNLPNAVDVRPEVPR